MEECDCRDTIRTAHDSRAQSPRRSSETAHSLEEVGAVPERAAMGTVREDYSNNGDAWNFFTHDHARSRAYRWGEDGLGGSPTTTSGSASPSPCGTARTRS